MPVTDSELLRHGGLGGSSRPGLPLQRDLALSEARLGGRGAHWQRQPSAAFRRGVVVRAAGAPAAGATEPEVRVGPGPGSVQLSPTAPAVTVAVPVTVTRS